MPQEGPAVLADLIMLGTENPYIVITAIAVLCAAVIWRGTR